MFTETCCDRWQLSETLVKFHELNYMPQIKAFPLKFLLSILFVLVLCPLLLAQGFYFGRNKVQYTDFDWRVMKTEHFDIYYYPEMEEIARKGAHFAEESFRALEPKFNHSVSRRIPLIFYSTHLHFQQTNVTPGFIPEGVGGFFEFLKGRVVIPSNGDLAKFRHVIQHELVHVFMHSKVYTVLRNNGRLDGPFPPLWFTEGLAEFWSSEWDAQAEMVLKDAVLHNYETGLSNIWRILGTFTMYKVGQDVMIYIAENYGEDKLLLLMENLWKYESFEESFKEVLGMDYAEFDRHYLPHLKKRYYPKLADEDFNRITDKTIVRDGYNFKPAWYKEKSGTENVVFVGNRTGYSSIFMKPLRETPLDQEESVEVLIKGEASSDFEAFHIFDSKIDVNKDGVLAFTAKSGETDALYLYDIPNREIKAKHYFENIVGLYSPAWSPDGKQLVLSGLSEAGYADIFLFDCETTELRRLTDDPYFDTSPSWAPDGKTIVFSSNRTAIGEKGYRNLFLMDVAGGTIDYLTYGEQLDDMPVFSEDGKRLAYTSDAGGSYNIYLINNPLQKPRKERKPVAVRKLTSSVGAIFDPEWMPNGDLLYGTFEEASFQIRQLQNTAERLQQSLEQTQLPLALNDELWDYPTLNDSRISADKPYVKDYDLDIVQTQVSEDPIFGTTGGAQLAFTDLMGNEQYNILLYNNARGTSDFWESFNFAVTKISLGQKVNHGYGVFRFAGQFYNPQDAFYFEDRVGAFYALIYPFSQFSRVEFNQSISYSDKEWTFLERRFAWLNTSYVSFIHDNAIWSPTGPIEGRRLNVTLGNTYDFAFSNVNYLTGLVDLRYYHRLGLRTAYAVRLMSLFNEGRETRQFYFGGSWDLRGYSRWSLRGQRVFLLSQEYRFPLIDVVGMRLPWFSLGFSSIRGALFFDVGQAWNEDLDEVLGSFGVGARLPLGRFLVLRWDFGKTTDFNSISDGIFTQFFFGWDF